MADAAHPALAPGSTPRDFIREIVDEDLRTGKHGGPRGDALSARAERLPPHRTRQVDLPELRRRPRVRRDVQPPLRRHEPAQGGRRVRRLDPGGRPLARLRLGGPRSTTPPTTSRSSTSSPRTLIRTGKAYVCDLSADERPQVPGTLTEPGQEQPLAGPVRRGEPRSLPPDASGRVSRRLANAPGARSTWPRPTSICAIRRSTGSGRPRTTGRATRGASTRCTTMRTRSPTRSRGSRTRSARWSSRTTGRSTTGASRRSTSRTAPARSSSRGST